MYVLPIVQREMSVAARRGDYYRIRYVAGGVVGLASLAAIFWCSYVWRWSTSPGLALYFFTSLIGVLAAVSAGLFLTVDALSHEKREGTLGLLFLTELKGLDIVLGKLSAAGSAAASGFLTLFPILVLSLCLGGVTGPQVWRMTAALLVLLFVSLALGLFISALMTNETLGTLCFLALMLLPTGLAAVSTMLHGTVSETLLRLNPLYPAFAAVEFDPGPAAPPLLLRLAKIPATEFAAALRYNLLSAVSAILVTGWLLPRQIRSAPGQNWFLRARRKLERRLPSSRRQLQKHPVLWLSTRDTTSGLLMWGLIVAGLVFYRWDPLAKLNPAWDGLGYPVFLHAVIKWHLAFAAGQLAARERSSGLMETLVTTPIESGVILRSHRLALRRHFLAPVIVAIGAHFIYILPDRIFDVPTVWGWVAFASMVLLYVDFYSLSWLGIWNGLRKGNGLRAFLQTVLFGFLLPWLPFPMLVGAFAFIVVDLPGPVEPLLAFGFISAAFFSALVGVIGMAQSHFRLRKIIATA